MVRIRFPPAESRTNSEARPTDCHQSRPALSHFEVPSTDAKWPGWKLTGVEIDATLAHKAQAALANWPQVRVIHADGAGTSFEPVDVIVASAGATHPSLSWLDALRLGGRLLFPMTTLALVQCCW